MKADSPKGGSAFMFSDAAPCELSLSHIFPTANKTLPSRERSAAKPPGEGEACRHRLYPGRSGRRRQAPCPHPPKRCFGALSREGRGFYASLSNKCDQETAPGERGSF